MFIVASTNASVGIEDAMSVLIRGAAAVDAVEIAIRHVESNADDHSVGYGGYPNLIGEVELDAGMMEGLELTAGAVAALQGFKHPISVARDVMEHLPHVLLVGKGAERFAAEMGHEPTDLLTEAARDAWWQRVEADLPPGALENLADRADLWRWVEIATDPEHVGGTTNVIAQDADGDLCAGVSTSGWAWKYPGRVGDSPIIGAGLYADNRYGAAACTGTGEMAIKAATARSVVLYLRMGLSLEAAGQQAMADLNDLGGPYLSGMNFIAVDGEGRHIGFSNRDDASYLYLDPSMAVPREFPRTQVPLKKRWQRRGQNSP
ncbi:MAG: N(4)-(beta-N-acetylglucosaminyl)-L-asparaginase [Anaerolineae bacterium]